MRKIYSFILVTLLVTCLISCKKDSSSTKVSIVGKWTPTSVIATNYINGNLNSTEDLTTATTYVPFNSDGTGISADKNGAGILILTSFNYTVSGSTIALSRAINTLLDDPATVTQLTANSLVIHQEESAVINNVTSKGVTDASYSR